MTINVVMFSITPLAGAPIRIAKCLNRNLDVNIRLVDTERWGFFEHDHVHSENPDITYELAEKADILHLFNYLDANAKNFAPLDFRDMTKAGKKMIRQFESTPMYVADNMGITLEEVLTDPIPKIVIAQYPERFLPDAMVVPNMIPLDDQDYMPTVNEPGNWDIVYSPTWTRGAWDARWDTKGMPQTVAMLKAVEKQTDCKIKVVNQKPLEEVLDHKKKSSIIIDELVTGSYHLSGLEGLSLAKTVLCYLDTRTDFILRQISGANQSPFVNVRLEDSFEVLCHLINSESERNEIGTESRRWMEKYWNNKQLEKYYLDVYHKVLEDPKLVQRQPEFRLDSMHRQFFAVFLPDRVFEARMKKWLGSESYAKKAKRWIKGCLFAVGQTIRIHSSDRFFNIITFPFRKMKKALFRWISRFRPKSHFQ